MKKILYTTLLLAFVLPCTTSALAQTTGITAGKAGKFGIDGDLISDQALTGISANQQAGTHDWFQKAGGTGVGVFDTVGAAAIKQRLMKGENLAFSRKMQYPRYSVQGGDVLMDASYTRDHFGIEGTQTVDKTVFRFSNQYAAQMGGNPSQWQTVLAGEQIPAKTDIIDTYVNLRRDGTTVSANNPSHIMLHVGATTLAADGDRYVSFVFMKERMAYDSTTGYFANSGPVATNGHSAWTFNTDGTVKGAGDMAVSFSFGSGGVQEVQLLIWCNYNDFSALDPAKFDFVPGQWYGMNTRSGYGWAGIIRNAGSALQVFGTTNSVQIGTPAWGSSSKSLGDVSSNYAANGYEAYQFAEASIDLTSAGVDFALSAEGNCAPPFTRYLVVTRSSSGFTSPLRDFIGPYEFMDAPTASAAIVSPGHFTCTSGTTLSLSPKDYLKGAIYSWRTDDGHIAKSSSDSSTIQITKPGTYSLTASMMQGCATSTETIWVGQDFNQPIAKASSPGMSYPGETTNLFGGDPVASNYTTPFGGSKGLTYSWTGPTGFAASTQQNTTTKVTGEYQLVVTEVRNGCKDTAVVQVVDHSAVRLIVLDVKFTDLSISVDKASKRNRLTWKMNDINDLDRFVVEKSTNGTVFTPVGNVSTQHSTIAYGWNDPNAGSVTYYRVKAFDKIGIVAYSGVIRVAADGNRETKLTAYNDGSGNIVINYNSAQQQLVNVSLVHMNGQVIKQAVRTAAPGTNLFRMSDIANLGAGVYLVNIQSNNDVQSVKIKL
ncbi:MAG: T9SS type A sorting domain-containing protein [Bacteroidota bacterium]|nr:T9SS type A sorting domain-containing protein [Bacteroidota bacterium]